MIRLNARWLSKPKCDTMASLFTAVSFLSIADFDDPGILMPRKEIAFHAIKDLGPAGAKPKGNGRSIISRSQG